VLISQRWLWAGRAGLVAAGMLVVVASGPEIVARQPTTVAGAALAAGLLAFVAAWAWFWLSAVSSGARAAALALGLLTPLVVLITIAAPPGRDGLVLLALALGAGLPPRWAGPSIGAACLVAGVIQAAHGQAPTSAPFTVVNDAITGAAGMGGRLLVETNENLRSAREEIARLAVAEERLRFARDLHDLIGQNLTVVALKTDLVSRELSPGTPDRLRDELRDVAAMTRRSLDDIRSLVADYRQPGLPAELGEAGAALEAAGIALSVEDRLGPVPTPIEAVLAWTIREGTTNIIKHSRASHGRVRLHRRDGSAVLELEDDGPGGASGTPGSGLRGIAERAAALGGTFDVATTAGGRGFRLILSVPLPPR
jgi:two-component system, NarL family, sensor histidine kinase DesK